MRYGAVSRFPKDKLVEKAIEYFEQFGMTVVEQTDSALVMEREGDAVTIRFEDSDPLEIEILTKQMDIQVKKFIQRIAD